MTVTVLSTGKVVTFVVDGWLSKYEGDRSLELTRTVSTQKGKGGSSRYIVKVKTGTVQQKRCTARVFVTLFGANDKVTHLPLPPRPWSNGVCCRSTHRDA